jgi:hypothetical protein
MNTLKQILDYLDGKKTYISSVLLAGYGVLKVFSIIDTTADQDAALLALLGSLLGISLRDAINKK